MKQRIITGIILILCLVPLLIFGDKYHLFTIFCLLFSLFASFEFRRMLRTQKQLPIFLDIISILFTGGLFVIGILSILNQLNPLWVLIYFMGVILVYALCLVFFDDFKAYDFGNSLSTILYTSVGFIAFAYLRTISLEITIYVFLVSMLTDTFAYFFGIKFGKTRLAEKISPKKSVEGAVAGLIIGSGLSVLFALQFDVFPTHSVWFIIFVSLILSFLGQIGDLVASKFKRTYQIKDYSNLFPGHGGVLDRFDSSMFIALSLVFILLIESVI